MLLLVRHAHAGDKSRWQGHDSLRPLSAAGQAEAAGLVVRLDDYPVERILSSPTVRCQQTVEPLARDRRLPIEPTPALAVAAEPTTVLALLEDPALRYAVLCTHGEVIGRVLVRLVADGLAVGQPLAWPKGSTWLLDGPDGQITLARYLPPLPLTHTLIPALHATRTPPRPGGLPAVRRPLHQGPVGWRRRGDDYRRFM